MNSRTWRLAFVLGALALVVGAGAAASPELLIDLPPTYCGARALDSRADPYRVEPLSACVAATGHQVTSSVPPTPLPPFVLAAFVPLARLPFALFVVLYVVAAFAACAAASGWLANLARVPVWTVAIAFLWGPLIENTANGQLSVFALAGVCACAFYARRNPVAATAGACAAFLQPQFGLPVAVALFAAAPRARLWLVAAAVPLLLATLIAGFSLSVEYLRFALPLQVLAEVHNAFQFSSTWFAGYAFGASAPQAVRIGESCGAVSACVALACAVAIARRGPPEFAILGTAAIVTCGAAYEHAQQLELALPAGFYLAGRAQAAWLRTCAAAGACALGGEWVSGWELTGGMAVAFVGVRAAAQGAAFAVILRSRSRPHSVVAVRAVAFALPAAAIAVAYVFFPPPSVATSNAAPRAAATARIAESWRTYEDGKFASADLRRIVAIKVLPWCGNLAIVLCTLAAVARRKDAIRTE